MPPAASTTTVDGPRSASTSCRAPTAGDAVAGHGHGVATAWPAPVKTGTVDHDEVAAGGLGGRHVGPRADGRGGDGRDDRIAASPHERAPLAVTSRCASLVELPSRAASGRILTRAQDVIFLLRVMRVIVYDARQRSAASRVVSCQSRRHRRGRRAAALAGCTSATPEPPADLLVTNAAIYAADGSSTLHEALAVRGDRIVAVGRRRLARLRGPATVVIDAAGRSVVPGFNDTHLHLFEGGFAAERADVGDATTVAEVQAALREFAAAQPSRPWVLGEGWRYNTFPGGLPTRAQLDAVVADRPAFVRCFDYHTAWVNSKALALAGITRDTPDPVNGTHRPRSAHR